MATNILGSFQRRLGVQLSQKVGNNLRRYASTTPIRPSVLNTPMARVSKLSNGMRVATEEWPGETASVGVFIKAGSVLEEDSTHGVAHFLEHMAFKGTQQRTRKQLEEETENLGAHLNAYTARDHTAYFARSYKNDVPKMLSILGDILLNSKYDAKAVESEKNTIITELETIEDDDTEMLFDHVHSAAFQDSPYGRTILGTRESIQGIQRQDLVNFVENYYTGSRMILVATGAVKHDELCAQAEKIFANVSAEERGSNELKPIEFIGSEIRIRNDDHPLVRAAIAVEGPKASDPDFFTAQLIQAMVGSWDRQVAGGPNLASKLAETISLENLAHSYHASSCFYPETGFLSVNMVAPPRRVDDLVFEILNEYQRIGASVTEKEVQRAKDHYRSGTMLQSDGTDRTMQALGLAMINYGRPMSLIETAQRINDITVADVKRVATTYFNDVSPVVVAHGPVEFFPDYNTTRSWTYWNRL